MTTGKVLTGKLHVGNPHVRFDEGEGAPAATPRRGSLEMMCGILAIVLVCSGVRADVVAGNGLTAVIDVGAGNSETLAAPVVQGDWGRVYKTGAGTLTIRNAALNGSPFKMEVLSGEVALDSSAAAPAAATAPDAVTAKAALWLDASAQGSFFLADGSAAGAPAADPIEIATWKDRRETSGNDNYPRAVAAVSVDSTFEASGRPKLSLDGDRARVYFNGYGSGCYMELRNASNNLLSYNNTIRHIFFVYDFTEKWGYMLGKRVGDAYWYHANDENCYMVDNSVQMYLANWSVLRSAVQAGTWINGHYHDPYTQRAPRGYNLLRQDYMIGSPVMDALFSTKAQSASNQPGSKGGVGGDYLCEVIVFTNVLKEVDIAQIDDYLMRKWNLPRDGTRFGKTRQEFALAAGTTLSAEVAANSTTYPVSLSGAGTVEKTGAGDLAVGTTGDEDFSGTVDLLAGGIVALGGRLPPVQLDGGREYNTVVNTAGNNSDQRDARGLRLTKSSLANANEVRKTGLGELRANGIDPQVTHIDVAKGTLILEAPSVARRSAVDSATVAVTNADFEMPADVGYGNNWASLVATNGWWTKDTSVLYADHPDSSNNYCSWLSPAGGRMVKCYGRGQVITTVNLPVAGTYEFSFCSTSRQWRKDNTARTIYDVVLADATQYEKSQYASFPVIGCHQMQAAPWLRRTFRFTVDHAGSYYIGLRHRESVDNYAYFDAMRVDYVADAPRTDVWPIPNGDLEDIKGNFNYIAYTNVNVDGSSEIVKNWTFAQPDGGTVVGLARFESSGYADSQQPICIPADPRRKGQSQLMLRGNTGTATTTFRPPAGRWRLQARVARNTFAGIAYNNETPGLKAMVTVGEASALDLGTVATAEHLLRNRRWPTVFETDGSADVTLVLANVGANDQTISDDFVLVAENAAGDSEGTELVKNGGFEEGESSKAQHWTLFAKFPGNGNPHGEHNGYGMLSYPQSVYAPTACEGKRGVRLQQSGGVCQTVKIPEAGTYRLKFSFAPRPGTNNGWNSLEAWISQGNATNHLGKAICATDGWQEFAFTFDVAAAGSYVVGINGIGQPGCSRIATYGDQSHCDHTSVLDAVSLKRVDRDYAAEPTGFSANHAGIFVAEGASLRLDYSGTISVCRLKLGGVFVPSGTYTAANYPEYLSGRGSIVVAGKGTIIMIR